MSSPTERDQPTEALAYANKVRLSRSRWRKRTAALPSGKGRMKLVKALESGTYTSHVDGMKLEVFLSSARRIGPNKAREIINEAGVRISNPRMKDLTERERGCLASVLRRRANLSA